MKKESWQLAKLVAEFKRKGGVVKKYPCGVPVFNSLNHVVQPIKRAPAMVYDEVVSYNTYQSLKSVDTTQLQRLISKTGLPERLIPKRLGCRPETLQSAFKTGQIPHAVYDGIIKLIKERKTQEALMEVYDV